MDTLLRVALLGVALPILLLACKREALADESHNKSFLCLCVACGPHHMASAARQRGRRPCLLCFRGD